MRPAQPYNGWKRWRGKCRNALLLVLFCIGTSVCAAQPKEYQVKAVFLFNFIQFVEWPPSAFNGPNAPFVIGILGDDPFGNFLDETVKGEAVLGRPIIVQRFSSLADLKHCHILYVHNTEANQALHTLNRRHILTVGESRDFTQRGGIIQFYTEQNRIRLQVSPAAAKTANISISSKLLRLARISE